MDPANRPWEATMRSDVSSAADAATAPATVSHSHSPSDTVASPSSPSSSDHLPELIDRFPLVASSRNPPIRSRSQTLASDTTTGSGAASSATAAGLPFGKPIKRKPLSSTASVSAIRFSASGSPLPSPLDFTKPEARFSRDCTIDSPTLYEFAPAVRQPSPFNNSPDATVAYHDVQPSETQSIPQHSLAGDGSDSSDVGYDDLIPDSHSDSAPDSTPETVLDTRDVDHHSKTQPAAHDRDIHHETSDAETDDARSAYSDQIAPDSTAFPMSTAKPTPPHLQLDQVDNLDEIDDPPSAYRPESSPSTLQTGSPKYDKTSAKSQGPPPSPFAALFSWGAPSPSATEFSSTSSPISLSRTGTANDTPYDSYLSSQTNTAQLDEMEDELKGISAELASSIRREMDLEDLVDRLQEQISNPQAPGKRSSDYFSDSGYSSAKVSESDQSRDEVEKIQRRSEQEKATLRLELTNKLQDERTRRKALDQQIKQLAERASQIDLAEMNNLDANGRLKDLEETCGDLRRRLSEERTVKNNFEDLLSALKGELHDTCNERDNLRDEIVPQLKARVEGLEAEAAEYANLTYESSKMQQELQNLKKENDALKGSSSGYATPTNRMSRAMSGGLARSNSVATGSFRNQRPSNLDLGRSNSVKGGRNESREALAERLKDVEAQRDALHSALKNLLDRQDFQTRENDKKIRMLHTERERLLTSSPRKAGFEREIANLRTEINVLRRRVEDALEEKWEVEKGLGGLKMDLDRAEEEIVLLRDLLKEKDILIPPSIARASGSSSASSNYSPAVPVTSESLENAYKELQAAFADSLERVKKLELEKNSGEPDEKTQHAMERLERTLSIAVTERDTARQEIAALKIQFGNASATEAEALEGERALADELSESARRVEELASQVQQQLAANAQLRQRLADTVQRNEGECKSHSDRIAELQIGLRGMEEQLVAAQTASEERVAKHEEEISALREAHNEQLLRMASSPGMGGMRSPALRSPYRSSLLSPQSPRFPCTPRLSPEQSYEDAAQISALRERVSELEKALDDAGQEMQEVVAKMNTAQIQVLDLQEEREKAVRETRRLQKILEQEQTKSFEERFKTLSF